MQDILLSAGLLFTNPVILFLGILILGDIVLIPAIYFSVIGDLEFRYVLLAALLAALIGDMFWYGVGRYISKERLYAMKFFKDKREMIDHFSKKYAIRMLFISHFVIGSRLVTRVFVGMQRVTPWKVAGVNVIGTAVWTMFLLGLVYALDLSLGELQETAQGAQIGFALFLLIVGLVVYVAQRYFQKQWVDPDHT